MLTEGLNSDSLDFLIPAAEGFDDAQDKAKTT